MSLSETSVPSDASLLDMPNEVLFNIVGFLSYKEVGVLASVSTTLAGQLDDARQSAKATVFASKVKSLEDLGRMLQWIRTLPALRQAPMLMLIQNLHALPDEEQVAAARAVLEVFAGWQPRQYEELMTPLSLRLATFGLQTLSSPLLRQATQPLDDKKALFRAILALTKKFGPQRRSVLLAIMAWQISGLVIPAAIETAFYEILEIVTQLPKCLRELPLAELASQIARLPHSLERNTQVGKEAREIAFQAIFALTLHSPAATRTVPLEELARALGSLSLASRCVSFQALLKEVEDLPVLARSLALAALASQIPWLPRAERVDMFEAVREATARLPSLEQDEPLNKLLLQIWALPLSARQPAFEACNALCNSLPS